MRSVDEIRKAIVRLATRNPTLRAACYDALQWLEAAKWEPDPIIAAECLRIAQARLEAASG